MRSDQKQPNIWKGMLVGLIAGLVASWTMDRFQDVWIAVSPPEDSKKKEGQARASEDGEEGQDEATVNAASAISERLFEHKLTRSEKKIAGPAVHYAVGATSGINMGTGYRTWKSEVSTIDTAFLIAGALTAAQYFNRDTSNEREIRNLADELYRRADWQWAQHGALTISHGWKPETGFIKYRWTGYSEALILYILALASPTFPISPESYRAWTRTYKWKDLYGFQHLYAGPLFIHQLSHMWIDFRGIQDEYMKSKAIDYFENTRRATYAQQQYAIRNPKRFKGYSEHIWGITASDGPGPATRHIRGRTLRFYDYRGRGIPFGPDDGTLAPWAMIASLPFAPEIVLPSLHYFNQQFPEMTSKYGFKCSYNPTFADSKTEKKGWVSLGYYGLDQGPIVAMIENYRTGFLWRLMRKCPYIIEGLRRAGFDGGWLGS